MTKYDYPAKVVAVDVDDVLADLHTAWLARYNADYNDNLQVEQLTRWETSALVKPECSVKIYDYLKDPALYDTVLPYPDAKETVDFIRGLGHRIVFATSSPPESAGRKFFWLRDYGMLHSYKDYIECDDKSLVHADILLDDGYHNVSVFSGLGILLTRPWNKAYEYTLRVNDLAAFCTFLGDPGDDA